MSRPVEPIRSRAARATAGDNLVQGRSVRHELAGRIGMAGLATLAIGGPLLEPADEALLADFFVCSAAADPRIWPIKVGRIVASYGDAIAGYAALYLAFTSQAIGPQLASSSGRLLRAIALQVGSHTADASAVRAEVQRRLESGERLPGFGAPFRPEDERVVAFRDCLRRRGREDGDWFRFTERVAAAALAVAGLPANIALWSAALCFELGLEPEQMGPLAAVLLLPPAAGVAFEGAALREPQLRRLPESAVHYVGPAPRRSPRAKAAHELGPNGAAGAGPARIAPSRSRRS